MKRILLSFSRLQFFTRPKKLSYPPRKPPRTLKYRMIGFVWAFLGDRKDSWFPKIENLMQKKFHEKKFQKTHDQKNLWKNHTKIRVKKYYQKIPWKIGIMIFFKFYKKYLHKKYKNIYHYYLLRFQIFIWLKRSHFLAPYLSQEFYYIYLYHIFIIF